MNKILVTGNGFDLNLGLKTSYQDFLKSDEFKEIYQELRRTIMKYAANHPMSNDVFKNDPEIKTVANIFKYSPEVTKTLDTLTSINNKFKPPELTNLIEYINNKKGFEKKVEGNDEEIIKWVDIEISLKDYVKDINNNQYLFSKYTDILFADFIFLKKRLTIYLKRVQEEFIINEQFINAVNKTIAYQILEQENFNKIITFNYTSLLLKLKHSHYFTAEYLYIHGNLEKNNIVFGVEDGGVDPKFAFLNKSDHHAYGAVNLRDEVENAQEIHFFGCALGATDDTHFKPVFEYLTSRDSRNEIKHVKRKIVFYVYAKEGYRSLFNNLLRHTKNRVGELKVNNQVIFYDVSGEHLIEIDQNWLNSFKEYP